MDKNKPFISRFAGRTSRRKVRVLVVEDSATNQRVTLGMLELLGYSADAVANGKEAIEALEQVSYDLVLMDCQMPDMDGFEATAMIRDRRSAVLDRRIPVIAMTARPIQDAREKCLGVGMNDYLLKPVTMEALAESLDKWLADGEKPGVEKVSGTATAPAPGTDVSVFDKAGLLDRLMGDEEMCWTVLTDFVNDFPPQAAELKKLVGQNSAPEVERSAHAIAGAAAMIGGDALCAAARKIEKAGANGDLGLADALIDELVRQFEALRAAIAEANPPMGASEGC